MSAAQFLFDRDEELWWIDEAADGGTHEPDAGHFVRDVPDEMLAELLAVRHSWIDNLHDYWRERVERNLLTVDQVVGSEAPALDDRGAP